MSLVSLACTVLLLVATDADQVLVSKSVGFLLEKQAADGSYSVRGRPELGVTALVARGLAEARLEGDAPLAAKRDAGLAKCVAFMLAQQKDDGSFTQDRAGLSVYRTSLVVLTLAAIDRKAHAEAITKAGKWLASAQNADEDSADRGGWGYDKGSRAGADLSNTHLALAALRESGFTADDPAVARALAFVSRLQNRSESNPGVPAIKLVPRQDGGFFYSTGGGEAPKVENPDGTVSFKSYASMTYAGLASMAYSGLTEKDPRVRAALGWIAQHYGFDQNFGLGVRGEPSQAGLYYFYFNVARALHALGKDEVQTSDGPKRWGRDLLDALAARQAVDGSFANTDRRWMENLPELATAFALNAANAARAHAGAPPGAAAPGAPPSGPPRGEGRERRWF